MEYNDKAQTGSPQRSTVADDCKVSLRNEFHNSNSSGEVAPSVMECKYLAHIAFYLFNNLWFES